MTESEARGPRLGWALVSFLLALCLHAGPAWFVLYGPMHGLPSVLEINLDAINWYRQRIFREPPSPAEAPQPAPLPLHVSVSVPGTPDTGKRVSKPRSEEDLARARAVQRAIRGLWRDMSPERTGYALVSLKIMEDGSIGESVVNRVSGDPEFQAFLLSFLAELKSVYGNSGGPGGELWIECEFVIQPMARKGGS